MPGGQLKYQLQFETSGLGNVRAAQEELRKLTGAPAGNANWVAGFRDQVNGLGRDLSQVKPAEAFGGQNLANVQAFNKEIGIMERGVRALGLENLANGLGIFRGLKEGAAGFADGLGMSAAALGGVGAAVAAVAAVGYSWYRNTVSQLSEMADDLQAFGDAAEEVQQKVRGIFTGPQEGIGSAVPVLEGALAQVRNEKRQEMRRDGGPRLDITRSMDQEMNVLQRQLGYARERAKAEEEIAKFRTELVAKTKEEDARKGAASDALRDSLERAQRSAEQRGITLRLALADGDIEQTRKTINEIRNAAAQELSSLEAKGLNANTMSAEDIAATSSRMEDLRNRIQDMNLRGVKNEDEAVKEKAAEQAASASAAADKRKQEEENRDSQLRQARRAAAERKDKLDAESDRKINNIRDRMRETASIQANVERDSYAQRGLFAAGGGGAGSAAQWHKATAEGVRTLVGQLAVLLLMEKARKGARDVVAAWGGNT